MTHREKILQELETLHDPNFEIPAGLYIPLGDRILVKEDVQGDRALASGIIVPGSAALQNAKIGVVYRMGEGVTHPIKPGMKVAYDKFALAGIYHNGVQYTDLMGHQVYSVVPPENYLEAHSVTTEEIRRKDRVDFNKRSLDKTDKEIDQILNKNKP